MQRFIEELKEFELMAKTFDCLRLIDIDNESISQEYFLKSCSDLISDFDYNERREVYEQCLESNSVMYKVKQKNQYLYFFAVFSIFIDGNIYILECVANITESLEMNQCCKFFEGAYKLSITDELTGVYNRRYINKALPIAINRCAHHNKPLSVIFTDLDFFKNINDLYSHSAGDYVLSEFSIELNKNIKSNNGWVARYGGDEFLICLIDVDYVETKILAEKIRKSIETKKFIYRNEQIKVTCSLGVCTIDDFSTVPTFDSIFKAVDKQLYMAKHDGRNKVR
ncbi:MAG: GGDEF domain-containing protein [Aminipila sp.]